MLYFYFTPAALLFYLSPALLLLYSYWVARLKPVANALLLLCIVRLYSGTWHWCLQGLLD